MKRQWNEFKTKPRYSVMRIEIAKQKALTGESFGVLERADRMLMDWTGDDEQALYDLIDQWDGITGHAGLNRLIDNYAFSGGKHGMNTRIKSLIEIDCGEGAIRYLDKRTPFATPAYEVEGFKFQGNTGPAR